MLKITVVSDMVSWINQYIPELIQHLESLGYSVVWLHDVHAIPAGDLVFFLGCGQLVPNKILKKNRHNLVVHESSLPQGRGWSPLSWQILAGENDIPICLFEAEEKVDSGKIYLHEVMHFDGHELVDELRKVQGETTIRMCCKFIFGYPAIIDKGMEQVGDSTYYPKRKAADSRIDPDKAIRDQFNLLRIVDNISYPAFFDLYGETYILNIKKLDNGKI